MIQALAAPASPVPARLVRPGEGTFDTPYIDIVVPYPISNPERIEREIAKPVEEALGTPLSVPGRIGSAACNRSDRPVLITASGTQLPDSADHLVYSLGGSDRHHFALLAWGQRSDDSHVASLEA